MEAKHVVRAGYDAIASRYRQVRTQSPAQDSPVRDLAGRLPRGAKVLDAGCGAGVPVARLLSESFDVVGIDLSTAQLRLARESVPRAEFQCQDMTEPAFRDGAFDAICSLYAIIHVPRSEHRRTLLGFRRTLKPGGLLLLCTGADDLPAAVDDYLGTRMYWSHYGLDHNLRMIEECGFETLWHRVVPDPIDPESAHLFVLARRQGSPPPVVNSSMRGPPKA